MGQFQSDSDYFRRRATEEQAAADRASDPRARRTHIDLAERYSEAARALDGATKAADAEPEPAAPVPKLQPEFRVLP